jgi:hypothetical protein
MRAGRYFWGSAEIKEDIALAFLQFTEGGGRSVVYIATDNPAPMLLDTRPNPADWVSPHAEGDEYAR